MMCLSLKLVVGVPPTTSVVRGEGTGRRGDPRLMYITMIVATKAQSPYRRLGV